MRQVTVGSGDEAGYRPAPLTRLWHYAAPFRRRTVIATVHSVLNKIFDLAPPLLIGLAVDVVANDGVRLLDRLGFHTQRTQIVGLALITFVVWALESLFEFFHRVAWRNLAQDVQHELRLDAYGHVQELEHEWLQTRATGDLMAVLNDDVNQLERFLDIGANEIVQVLTTVVVVGGVFLVLDPMVALLAMAPMPLILWGSFWFQRRLEPRYEVVRGQAGFLNGQLANNILGISTVKSFTAEDRETARIAARVRPLPRGQPAGHHPVVRVHAAHPHGDPGRLHRHDDLGWLRGHTHRPGRRRQPHRRSVRRVAVPVPAAPVAAHPAGRDVRPVPAGHGVDQPHPGRDRHRADHRRRHDSSVAATWRGSGRVRPRDVRATRRLHLPRTGQTRAQPASPSTT